LDPARATGFGFSLGAGETRNEGTLWVDDIGLVTGEAQPPPGETPPAVPVEEEPSGGLCPFSALVLPLGMVGVLLYRRRRSPVT